MFPFHILLSFVLLCNGQESFGQGHSQDTTDIEENTSITNNTITEDEVEESKEANFQFPEPHLEVEMMVEAAKDFVHKYLTAKKWHALKRLLQTVRDVGGTRRDGWRTVSVFLARVLTSDQKREIMGRREELYKIFGREIGIGQNGFH